MSIKSKGITVKGAAKKILALGVGAEQSSGGGDIVCLHPLDASASEVASNPSLTAKLTPSNADQTGTYTVQSGLVAQEDYGMFASGALTASSIDVDVSTGQKVMSVTASGLVAGTGTPGSSTQGTLASLLIYDKTTFNPIGAITFENNSGTLYVAIGSQTGSQTLYQTNQLDASIWYDSVTGNYGANYFNSSGVAQQVTIGAYSNNNVVAVLVITEQVSVAGGEAGNNSVVNFVTSGITPALVPSGFTTICG